ncbi:hypothetical protein LJC11_05705 [Bacteroidales bacterium OttesenSCG-928-I21]|nr:hypothetical protein [Bacteroidales bacterium OttesenSCG-928-I21]
MNLAPENIVALQEFQTENGDYFEALLETKDIIIECMDAERHGKKAFLALKNLSLLEKLLDRFLSPLLSPEKEKTQKGDKQ